MGKINWIKELVHSEQQMENAGVIDFTAGFDPIKQLETETIEFLELLKDQFVEYASAFNHLKGNSAGTVKIYGISQTVADFMIFRNGYKLIFSQIEPGKIAIRPVYHGVSIVPGAKASETKKDEQAMDDVLLARWAAYGELQWTNRDYPVNPEYLVKFYLSKFIRDSAK